MQIVSIRVEVSNVPEKDVWRKKGFLPNRNIIFRKELFSGLLQGQKIQCFSTPAEILLIIDTVWLFF